MLVLARKTGQKIMIGDDVTVTVIHVGGGRVRLGIQAPLELPVHRAELRERIRAEDAALRLPTLATICE